jgi:hypothetical protein
MKPAMQLHINHLDADERAREKQASRLADVLALSSGQKSADQLRQENEVFAPLARSARVNLAASRLLG